MTEDKPITTLEMKEDLNEIRKNVQWMWDNLHLPHTADHFNIPANTIVMIDEIILEWQSQQTKPTGLSKDEMEVWNEKGGLSKYEWELEKIVDKIRVTGTLEGIGILRSLLSNPPTSDDESREPEETKPVDSINFLKWVKDHVSFNDKACQWQDREGDIYTEEELYDLYTLNPTKPVEDKEKVVAVLKEGKLDWVNDIVRCTAKGCNEPCVGDYNGHGAFACEYHMKKWNDEFDEDYK